MHSAESLALMEDEHLATGPSRIGYWRLGCLMGLGNGSRHDGKAMQCFILIWFNGQWLMREGLWICGLAKFPPYSYVIILRMHHYTVHESCLMRYALYEYACWPLPLSLLSFWSYTSGINDHGMDYEKARYCSWGPKTALSAPLRSLATNRMQLCNLTQL